MGLETLALLALGTGTVMQMQATIEEGRRAEKIGEARAEIDIQRAEKVRKASVEEAKIRGERGRRFIEQQKGAAAAGNIRINVGSPLVIEAVTRDLIAKDIGFALETGREEAGFFRSRAAIERATGKAARRKSKWDAISQGIAGFGTIAFLGADAGWFSKTKTKVPRRFGSSGNFPSGAYRVPLPLG
jgi:hypothetical protein